MNSSLKEILIGSRKQDRKAQQKLFNQFSERLMPICRRYVSNDTDAEAILLEGFYKIFTKIDQCKDDEKFFAWSKKIMVNESLQFLRKYNMNLSVEINEQDAVSTQDASSQLSASEIMGLLDHLPIGYKTIFNLYAIEGYKHKEIAVMLGISINTSKSQLIKARTRLQDLLSQHGYKVA